MYRKAFREKNRCVSATSGPCYVITLVHGTFAPDAGWTQPGSRLRETIQRRLSCVGQVRFEIFTWRGFLGSRFNNGHGYRLRAGERFASELTRRIISYPNANHFVIAHSHGGNVVLYALRNLAFCGKLSGVVCIGTPFINCSPRKINTTMRGYPHIVLLVIFFGTMLPLFVAVCVGLLIGALDSLEYFKVPSNIAIWVAQLPFWGMIYFFNRNYSTWYDRLVTHSLIPWLEDCGKRLQEHKLARLHLPYVTKPAILCIRAVGDEAKLYLDAVRRIADIPYLVWNLPVYLVITLILSVCAFYWPLLLPEWLRERSSDMLHFILASVTAGVSGAILLSLIHFALLAIFPSLTRGHSGGFGQESCLDNMLLQISARPTPEGSNVADHEYKLDQAGLRHSGLYEDERVINDIADWILSLTLPDRRRRA